MNLFEQNEDLKVLKYGIVALKRELAKGNLSEVRYYANCMKEVIEKLSQDVQRKLREGLKEEITK